MEIQATNRSDNVNNLTPSKQHYIKAIHILSSSNEGVHITEIAKKLGIAKASVCTAMKALQKEKLVYRNSNRMVFLTETGRHQARSCTEKYSVIMPFLIEVLHVNYKTAEADACALEHVVSN